MDQLCENLIYNFVVEDNQQMVVVEIENNQQTVVCLQELQWSF
jgi:hypothetical protein